MSERCISGIILAAGRSSRFGAPKVLESFNGKPFLQRITDNLKRMGCTPVVLVLGHNAERIRLRLPPSPVDVITVNRDYESGQFSSVQAGIAVLPPSCLGTFLCLIDQPHLEPQTYHQIFAAVVKNPDRIVIPSIEGRRGHPVYLPARLFPNLLREPATSTLRDVIQRHSQWIVYQAVTDAGIYQDIDTPADLQRLVSKFRSS